MLVRLISARQVVLLHTGLKVTLFYAGQAYYRSATDAFLYVPRREGKNNHPVWALIDMDFLRSEPPLDGTSQVWPIQASTLNPVRWGNWSKRFNAANWGMPLWTMEELVLGCVLQSFLSLLMPVVERPSSPLQRTSSNPVHGLSTQFEEGP